MWVEFCHRFEIIVTFTGASTSNGQTTEERTSYLSREIAWGHRFVNMVAYDTENGEYFVDYDKFDMTEEVLNTSDNFWMSIDMTFFFWIFRLTRLCVALNGLMKSAKKWRITFPKRRITKITSIILKIWYFEHLV